MDVIKNAGGFEGLPPEPTAAESELHSAYERVAAEVPRETLKDGITHVFNSESTPPFERLLAGMFGRSNSDQKAGLLNQVLGALGPNATRVLESAGLGGILSGSHVTPADAEKVSPQAAEVLAGQAARTDPTIVDRAAGFYAQHPNLVKALGVGALAMLMSRMSRR